MARGGGVDDDTVEVHTERVTPRLVRVRVSVSVRVRVRVRVRVTLTLTLT